MTHRTTIVYILMFLAVVMILVAEGMRLRLQRANQALTVQNDHLTRLLASA